VLRGAGKAAAGLDRLGHLDIRTPVRFCEIVAEMAQPIGLAQAMVNHVQPSHEGLTMKKTLITSAVFSALIAGSAMAADLKAPILTKAPVMAPVYNWTGCYIGAGFGYGMWNQDNIWQTDPGHVAIAPTETSGGRGWFGTAGAGCDYQVSSSIVIGAFGDWDFADIKGQFDNFFFTGTESEKWAWAAGGRIGYLVTPTILTYFSGGYTQAHFDQISLFGFALPLVSTGNNIPAHTYSGWFLGSGIDYAISFLPSGFFLRSEYRYSTYQAADVPILVSATGLSSGLAVDSKKQVQSVRTELTYRFNWH
jgi:outer membrane immunogenic protein